jgi:parvulin-like peptidyl-prolyl isomerase
VKQRLIGNTLAAAVVLAGGWCARPALAADGSAVVAKVNGQPITMDELQRPLLEAYGLNILLYQIQLKLAQQHAKMQKIVVTPADVEAEMTRTLKGAFQDAPKEDYPNLLQQLLGKQGISRAEFDIVIETRAILRKIAEPELKDAITEEKLREAFNAMYGETAVVRHVQLSTPRDAEMARARLASGETFEAIVQTMSMNDKTRPLQGELPQFSRQMETWGAGVPGKIPNGFKDWAFDAKTKVGDVSETISADGGYHILKLERRVAPKAVKFENVREGLKADLQEKLVEQGVAQLRVNLQQMARQQMVIEDPILKKAFDARIAEQVQAAEAEKKARQDIFRNAKPTTNPLAPRPATTAAPAATPGAPVGAPAAPAPTTATQTRPSGTPAPGNGGAAASPANAPTGERPPASKSAAPAPGAPDSPVPGK